MMTKTYFDLLESLFDEIRDLVEDTSFTSRVELRALLLKYEGLRDSLKKLEDEKQ